MSCLDVLRYGNTASDNVLIQPVDNHDLAVIENEIQKIAGMSGDNFLLLAVKVNRWNEDLSPWSAPAVFGNENFGEGASEMLTEIMDLAPDKEKTYYIGGYSQAGLFSLWASYQTDIFSGVAAASPSMWFPGFLEYMKNHDIQTGKVYLSLGDREEKTRNPVMATVGERIRESYALLREKGIPCTLEWNQGNHFREPDLRTAKAFAWLLKGDQHAD